MVYVAPITKEKKRESNKYLPFEPKIDVDYYDTRFNGGTVLLKKSGYVRPERIHSVVGVARPKFFKSLLSFLANSNNFECSDYAKDMADRLGDLQDDDKLLEFDNVEENIDSNTDSAQDNSEENTDTNVNENFTEKIDTEEYSIIPGMSVVPKVRVR